MRNIGSKKRFALIASTVAAVLVGSGIAVAFWTTTGTGTGSATAGTTTAVTVTQTNTITGLYPGGPAKPIDLNISNAAVGAVPAQIATVAVSITGVTPASCTASNFSVTNGTIGALVPATGTNPFLGGVGAGLSGATITLNETGSNQNVCKGAVVALAFAAS